MKIFIIVAFLGHYSAYATKELIVNKNDLVRNGKIVINWSNLEDKHQHIEKGPLALKSNGDLVEKIIFDGMPSYHHEVIKSNNLRFFTLSKQRLACGPFRRKNKEREQFLYFSLPIYKLMPLMWVFHKKSKPILINYESENGKSIDAIKLAKNKSLILGHIPGSSYGKEYDSIIDLYKKLEIHFPRHAQFDPSGSLTKMLLKGRIDIFLDTSELLAYEPNFTKFQNDFIVYIEPEKNYKNNLFYVACSKTPEGKKILDFIDEKLITTIRKTLYESKPIIFKNFPSIRDEFIVKVKIGNDIGWKELPDSIYYK